MKIRKSNSTLMRIQRRTWLHKYYFLAVLIFFYTSYYGIFQRIEGGSSPDGETGPSEKKGTLFSLRSMTNDCKISYGEYKGETYKWPISTVGDPRCLIESKWMKVMEHSVNLGGDRIIYDWLWIDYHDRINVLVQDPKDSESFLIFRQTKYALEGKESLAVIGGIIEPGETAENGAQREVNEELNGMVCDKYIPLGRFRTDVNRGLGWVNSFVATDCHYDEKKQDEINENNNKEEVGAADTERQDIISMKFSEVRQSVIQGEFMEVQWSNTVSLAMLHPEVMQPKE